MGIFSPNRIRQLTRRFATAILLVAGVSSPGCRNEPNPVQASPLPSARAVEVTIGGRIVDMLFRPLAEAAVTVTDGPRASTTVLTDGQGMYELPGAFPSPATVVISKTGYVSETVRLESQQGGRITTGAILQLDQPSINLSGEYLATFSVAASCSALPETVRTRTYPVTIGLRPDPWIPFQYEGVLTGAEFFPSSGGDRFNIGVAGTDARLAFGDPSEFGDQIVEEVAPRTYLAIWGAATLRAVGTTMTGTFSHGSFDYCTSATSLAPLALFQCPGRIVRCGTPEHQLSVRLVRR
jgi:hypothetical protein